MNSNGNKDKSDAQQQIRNVPADISKSKVSRGWTHIVILFYKKKICLTFTVSDFYSFVNYLSWTQLSKKVRNVNF